MAYTTTQFTNIADDIAKALVDLEAVLISDDSSKISTILGGLAPSGSTLSGRVGADSSQSNAITAAATVSNLVTNFITVSKSELYSLYMPVIEQLELALPDGIAGFMRANSLLVHPEFAACVNYAATYGNEQGLIGQITPGQQFVAQETSFGTMAVTGAAAGTFTDGSALTSSVIGNQKIWLKNTAGAPTTGTATVFHVTYTDDTNTSHANATVTMSGAIAAGGYFDTGLSGIDVTAWSVVSSGANTDALSLVAKPTRTVAY